MRSSNWPSLPAECWRTVGFAKGKNNNHKLKLPLESGCRIGRHRRSPDRPGNDLTNLDHERRARHLSVIVGEAGWEPGPAMSALVGGLAGLKLSAGRV
jgi:hypothetical protein